MEFIARVNVRDSEKVDDKISKIINDLENSRQELAEISNVLLKGIQIKIEDKQI